MARKWTKLSWKCALGGFGAGSGAPGKPGGGYASIRWMHNRQQGLRLGLKSGHVGESSDRIGRCRGGGCGRHGKHEQRGLLGNEREKRLPDGRWRVNR